MIDLDFVESLIRALDSSSLDSLELERGGTRIRLSKSPNSGSHSAAPMAPPASGNPSPAPPPVSTVPMPEPPSAPEAVGETPEADQGKGEEHLVEVTSPMVGTFYRAPAPDAPAYVDVGDRVQEGTVLCIIEAMKLMNELESEMEGTIARILVEDAEPVEFGQPLFLVDPS